jgi:nucleoside-triphosphatase
MNVLLTGSPGVGKTMVIKKAVTRLAGLVGGFYTQEIREDGRRVGFTIQALDGRKGILAHKDARGTYFVQFKKSDYWINLQDLDEIAVDSILAAIESSNVIVVDEIGHMELFSDKFREAVLKAFDSGKSILATISKYGGPFEEKLKGREAVRVIEVTLENRDRLADEVVKLVKV